MIIKQSMANLNLLMVLMIGVFNISIFSLFLAVQGSHIAFTQSCKIELLALQSLLISTQCHLIHSQSHYICIQCFIHFSSCLIYILSFLFLFMFIIILFVSSHIVYTKSNLILVRALTSFYFIVFIKKVSCAQLVPSTVYN